MDSESFLMLLETLHEECVREVIQGVRKQNNYDAIVAVGKLEGVELVARRVRLSQQQPFELKRPICRMR